MNGSEPAAAQPIPAARGRGRALCLDHLAGVVEAMGDPELTRALLRRQAGLFERTAEDMRRYALNLEAIRRPLASHAEVRSPVHARRMLGGLANLSVTRTDR